MGVRGVLAGATRQRIVLAVAALGLAGSLPGCGSSSQPAPAVTTGRTQTTSAAPTRKPLPLPLPTVRSPDERSAIAAADDYVRAFAASDWPAACAARTRADQASLASLSGTCTRAFAAIGRRLAQNKSPQGQPAAFATFHPSSVARRGGVIGVHFQSTDYRDELKFATVRDGARWRVTDIPDARIP